MEEKKQKYARLLFMAVTSVYWASLYAYVPNLTTYAIDPKGVIMANGVWAGLIGGAYGLVQMLLRIPLGITSDRLGRRKIFITVSLAISALSAVGMYFARSAFMLMLFRGLSGAAASGWVVFTVAYTSYFPKEMTGKAVGSITAANMTGQVIGMLSGGAAADAFGEGAAFLLAAGIAAAGFLFSFAIREERRKRPPISVKTLIKTGLEKNVLMMSFLAILVQLIAYGTVFGFTPEIAKQLGAGESELGLLSTLAILPGIFASITAGYIARRRTSVRWGMFGAFMFTALSTVAVPYCPSLIVLYIVQFLGGFGRGLALPMLMSLAIESLSDDLRSSAMGFFQAIYGLGMFAGPILVGALRDAIGLTAGFYVVAAIGAAGAVLSPIMISRRGAAE